METSIYTYQYKHSWNIFFKEKILHIVSSQEIVHVILKIMKILEVVKCTMICTKLEARFTVLMDTP